MDCESCTDQTDELTMHGEMKRSKTDEADKMIAGNLFHDEMMHIDMSGQ